MKIRLSRNARWALVGASAAMVASTVVERALDTGYRKIRRRPAPRDPQRSDTNWSEALLWSVGSAALVGAAQLVARRGAAAGWKRVTGRQPPRK